MMTTISIKCDASPLVLFTELLTGALQSRDRLFNFSDLGFELARVEHDVSSANTGELLVRLYPSDSFLRFAVTLLAGDVNLSAIE
jgi:hypothetical protein